MAEIKSNNMLTSSAGEKSTMDMNIDDENQLGIFRKVTQFLLRWGIETHGYVMVLILAIRFLILCLQNQPNSYREKDRQTYLSDVYYLVFDEFQHFGVQQRL